MYFLIQFIIVIVYDCRSDGSSDSENYMAINMGDKQGDVGDAMFHVGSNSTTLVAANNVEEASEVTEEEATITSPSESHSIASSYKRRDLVSNCFSYKIVYETIKLLYRFKKIQKTIKIPSHSFFFN